MNLTHRFRPWLLAAWGAGAVMLGSAATQQAWAQQTQQVTDPEARFAEGVRLFDRQLYGPAQAAFNEYLRDARTDPDRTADAQYYAAVSGLRLLQPDAEGRILQFAGRFPAHPKAALAYFELGRFYFERKEYDRAIPNLQKVAPNLLSSSQRVEADFKLAYAYYSTKDYEKARMLFDRVKTGQHEFTAPARYYGGFLAYQAKDYTNAKTDLQEAGKSAAYKNVVPHLLTQILYKQNKLSEVISYGEQVLAQTPPPQSADEIRGLVGDAYFQQEDYAKALPLLTAAAGKPGARGNRGEQQLEYRTAYAAYKSGDQKTAIERFQAIASQRDTLGQQAAYHLGLAYLKDGNKQYALTAFDQARLVQFDQAIREQATLKAAEVNFEQGNTRAVIQLLGDFAKQFPKSKQTDEADDMLSEAYLSSNDYPAAIRHIEGLGNRRSNKLNATYQRVTFYQAVNEFNAARFEAALAMLDKSLVNPVDLELRSAANFLKGEAMSAQGNWADAIQAYSNTFRVKPTRGLTDTYRLSRYGLGYAYYNSKKYAEAQVPFTAFLADSAAREADPNLTDARLRLADCYYIAKDYTQALALYDKVLAANGPNQDEALFQKGIVLGLMGSREQAVATLGQIPQRFPASRLVDNALFQQAQLEFEAARYAQAAEAFGRVVQQTPQSQLVPLALVRRGKSYANLQQFEPAVADFRKVLDDYATDPAAEQAIFALQEALSAAGKTEQFDQYLTAYRQRNPGAKSLENVEFEAAKSLYFAEKYELAVPKFEAFVNGHPQNALVPDARYYVADALIRGGDKKNGLTKMREVLNEGRTQYLNKALNRVADLSLEMQDYPTAIQYYQRLATAATSRRESANAQLGLLKATFAGGDYAKARQIAVDLLASGNATLNATNTALLYKAKSSYGLGQAAQALQELRATAEAANDENGAEAQYLLADAIFRQKQYKEALAEALKVNEKFGSYDRWVGYTFLLIADIYSAQGEVFQAKGTLSSLIDGGFPLQDIVAEARKKLANLNNSGNTDGEKAPAGTGNPGGKTRRQKTNDTGGDDSSR